MIIFTTQIYKESSFITSNAVINVFTAALLTKEITDEEKALLKENDLNRLDRRSRVNATQMLFPNNRNTNHGIPLLVILKLKPICGECT